MSFFDRRHRTVSCKVWNATVPTFAFPEMADPARKVPGLDTRPNVGIAFSGGGTRSASATLGQLRALTALDLLKTTRYISCVSGGAWACIPFSYLPTRIPDDTFLSRVIEPQDITVDGLQQTDRNSFLHAVANAGIVDDFIEEFATLAGDETYSRALGNIFLEPFQLNALKRFFSCTPDTVAGIRQHNPGMTEDDFYLVQANRPFLIVGSTLLRLDNQPPRATKIHFETTPLYAGARVLHPQAGSRNHDIGGGYQEPFGVDSEAPEDPPGADAVVTVRLGASRYRYTLSDVMGATGAAPAEVLDQIGLDFLGFPEFKHWPIAGAGQTREHEYTFGDGGHLENLGVMPLLARRVERIVVFVNTKDALRGAGQGQINDSIPPLFGATPGFMLNQVFPQTRYEPLVAGLLARKNAGKTALFQDTYRVQENGHYGIPGGWDVEVLWVYNEHVAEWSNLLLAPVRRLIGVGALGNFPHYKTFFQNPPHVIDLSAKQAQLLAHLSCWNVLAHADLFRQMLRS